MRPRAPSSAEEQHRALRGVYQLLVDEARHESLSPAAEWLHDNFHLVSAVARDIQHDLPAPFFKRLPRIISDESAAPHRRANQVDSPAAGVLAGPGRVC